jgi:YegS/Rv2252/BmrU family lipid kinase
MKRVMLVINPRSGKGLAPSARSVAEHLAKELNVDMDIRVIETPGQGTLFAKEAVAMGADRVICAGGDGTLNAVAAGLIGTSVAVGIVPLGSGNGYALSLGLPKRTEAAVRQALMGKPGLVDVCYLNEMPFLGTAGIGFDARVAYRFDKSKTRGMFGYAKLILQEVLGAPPMPVKLYANGETFDQNVLMVVFCNTREFGNGAVISPGSLPDDGLAEIRMVRKPSFFPLVRAFVQIYTNRADRSSYVLNIPATEATALQGGTLAHLDGEPHEIGHEVRFRLEPEQLWVVR